ncbi:hypothetical protein QTO34_019207 [Cnephaeus nilssonii]|uniref:Uncharacterized protein n=1 Tax=Cnephaeus nilssonii TaxID=3371016 RepID=A0AA40LC80_CNENI|nr:hypothetical protein QTO34_019207 [Eptesicus nilssonii]
MMPGCSQPQKPQVRLPNVLGRRRNRALRLRLVIGALVPGDPAVRVVPDSADGSTLVPDISGRFQEDPVSKSFGHFLKDPGRLPRNSLGGGLGEAPVRTVMQRNPKCGQMLSLYACQGFPTKWPEIWISPFGASPIEPWTVSGSQPKAKCADLYWWDLSTTWSEHLAGHTGLVKSQDVGGPIVLPAAHPQRPCCVKNSARRNPPRSYPFGGQCGWRWNLFTMSGDSMIPPPPIPLPPPRVGACPPPPSVLKWLAGGGQQPPIDKKDAERKPAYHQEHTKCFFHLSRHRRPAVMSHSNTCHVHDSGHQGEEKRRPEIQGEDVEPKARHQGPSPGFKAKTSRTGALTIDIHGRREFLQLAQWSPLKHSPSDLSELPSTF